MPGRMGQRVYRWQSFIGDPANELSELGRMPPEQDAPVSVWVLWHERHIACWEQIAAKDSMFTEHSAVLGECHRRKLKELHEDPRGGGRRGYWTP